jgi:hypothetical protein
MMMMKMLISDPIHESRDFMDMGIRFSGVLA